MGQRGSMHIMHASCGVFIHLVPSKFQDSQFYAPVKESRRSGRFGGDAQISSSGRAAKVEGLRSEIFRERPSRSVHFASHSRQHARRSVPNSQFDCVCRN